MPERVVPPDHTARVRIRTALDETLFVEAGAGSGKTTALVDRLVALVAAGVELRHVAAITFTEKAAAELRARVRAALEDSLDDPSGADPTGHVQRALEQLDGAAIGTLHAFAQRILREHPVEAELPPRIAVLDEVASAVAFEHRWDAFRAELLGDPDAALPVQLGLAAGITIDHLRQLARIFDDNWDLVATRLAGEPPDVPDGAGLGAVLDRLHDAASRRHECLEPADLLVPVLDELAAWVDDLRDVADDLVEVLARTSDHHPAFPKLKVGRKGRKENWPDGCIAEVRRDVGEAAAALDEWRSSVIHQLLLRLAHEVARFSLGAALERRADGRLEFHDLLVLARQVLRDPMHGQVVRRSAHRRYRRLLIDEFQDTDPLQIELAVLIATSPDERVAGRPWTDLPVEPGRLFFVGDPKQSIYRFRRADIALFLEAGSRFGPALPLDANFRTVAPVLDWVNRVFADLVQPAARAQPHYQPLRATQQPEDPERHRVVVLGAAAHVDDPAADEIRRREAADVVHAVRTALAEGWPVRGGEGWRPVRPDDIAVLLPSRLSLEILEDALDDAGLAYRAEASSLVYATRSVRDLLAAARAIDDPSDELSLVTALRSPLFGCGDDDLAQWRQSFGGTWNHQVPLPADVPADHPVAEAMAWLGELHRAAPWLAPSEVLERLVRERRSLESALAGRRHTDHWRRVRFVVDQARAWSEAEHGGLRDWLRWVAHQADEGQRAGEALLPETDQRALRILTVHAAKGLEFPVVVVSGLSTRSGGRRSGVDVSWYDGGFQVRLGGNQSAEYERSLALDEQLDHHERLRLLYVACTRARDHLVVSLHRKGAPLTEPGKAVASQLIADAVERSGASVRHLDAAPAPGAVATPGVDREPPPLAPFEEWRREREQRLEQGTRPRTIAATALAPDEPPEQPDDDAAAGLRKRPRDLDLPPWLKGRYGTAVGRAVHGVLQTVDLAAGHDLPDAVAAQCAAEGIRGQEATVHALADAARRTGVVQWAAHLPHWRELYVAVPVAGVLLEGYLDLLVRTPEGLVVIDYKTAATDDPAALDDRVRSYRWQAGAYALAAAQATDEPVLEVVFVFTTPAGAVERRLPDLADAVVDVERALREGVAARQARAGFHGPSAELDQDEPRGGADLVG